MSQIDIQLGEGWGESPRVKRPRCEDGCALPSTP